MSNKEYLQFAIEVAKAAGQLSLDYTKKKLEIRTKGHFKNLVSEADEAIETYIIQAIHKRYPEHQALGEESYSKSLDIQSYVWIIDPIDGTTNFCQLKLHYAISIALYDVLGRGILGVVYDPSRGELFHALTGEGAFLNGLPIEKKELTSLKQALVSGGFFIQDDPFTTRLRNWMIKLHREGLGTRIMACASLEMCYVAMGRLDIYIGKTLHPWDVAAALVILQELEYPYQRIEGIPFNPFEAGSLIVAHRKVFAEALELLES
jgi:myo-inositol-1(or 4)-monophosphatase